MASAAPDPRMAAVAAQLRAAEEDLQPLPLPPSFTGGDAASSFQLARAPTAAAAAHSADADYDPASDPYVRFTPPEGPYAVPLPEHLGPDARWDVYRCVHELKRSAAPRRAAQPTQSPPCSRGPMYAPHPPRTPQTQQSTTTNSASVSPRKLVTHFPPPDDAVATLHENWEAAAARFPHVPALGWRRRESARSGALGGYTWLTYSQAADIRTAIGSGLLQLGVPPGSGVGIYSINCKEWALFDAAGHAYGMVSVPLYDTLGPDAVEYICNHAELAAVGCSAAVLPVLLGCLARCPTVRLVVVWGDAPGAADGGGAASSSSSATAAGTGASRLPHDLPPGVHPDVRLVTIEACESLGRRHPRAHQPPRPSDVATLCYTSGTTGTPKGAVLTHANLIADSAGTSLLLSDWSPGDRHISYLPLAHIYERCNLVMCVHLGASVGFYAGDVTQLLDDVQALKPTLFASVPRLWNRIHDRVMAGVREGSPLARALFNRAYAAKRAALERGDLTGGRSGAFWDRLVFSKVAAKLGGNVKYMTTGASPISAEVMAFLRVCFPGAKVLEGYGMTESSCTICLTREDDPTVGHVGAPLPCCEVKLVDIPEMSYLTTDRPFPRGEVCVRGPTVFQGYYKQPEQTRECLDEGGWLHTGDVGCWLPGGRLRIIDRKKNIFKLAQGEYVAPEKIEGVYTRSPFVLQSFVHGDSLRSQLVAVVVPDPEYLLPWARERGLPQDLPSLCADPAVLSAVRKSMAEEARAAQLRGFEVVAAVALIPEQFSVENGLLTPTMKTKRNEARDRYRAVLDGLYAQLPEGGGGGGGGNGEGV